MLLVALSLVAAAPATAALAPVSSAATEPDRRPMLDKMLADHDRAGLARALNSPASPDALRQGLDWQRDKLFQGASIWIALHYSVELWRLAELLKEEEVKQTAALAMLYALGAAAIDGKRCRDVSAPGARLTQIAPAFRPIMAYLRGLPAERRRNIVDAAVNLESRTSASPDRMKDWFLCSGGMAEIQYGLKHGSTKPAPTPQGQIGETVAVDSKGYEPEFLPAAQSAKAVADQRAQLPTSLAKLAGI